QSSNLQLTFVKSVSFVSSSISLFRQQRPQPSHRLSHSARVISDIVLQRQNGVCGSDIRESLASPCSRWRGVRDVWSRVVNLSHSERPFNFCWRRRPAAGWPMGLNFLARLPPSRRNRYQRLKTASKHLM